MINFRGLVAAGLTALTFHSSNAPVIAVPPQAGHENKLALSTLNTWMKNSGFPQERVAALLKDHNFTKIMCKIVDPNSQPTLSELENAVKITEGLIPLFIRSEEQNVAFFGVLYDKIIRYANAGENEHNLKLNLADPRTSTPRDLLSQAKEIRDRLGNVPKIFKIGLANKVPIKDIFEYAQQYLDEKVNTFGKLLNLSKTGNNQEVLNFFTHKD